MEDPNNTKESEEDITLITNGNLKGCKEDLDEIPTDKCFFVFIICIVLGIGALLPWNVFINAHSYFVDYKLNTTKSYDEEYRHNFLSYVSLAANIPCWSFTVINLFGQCCGGGGVSNQRIRTIICLVISLVALVFTLSLAVIDSSDWPDIFFGLTLLIVAIINGCSGQFQSSVYAVFSSFPQRYTNAVVIGTNICGTVVALLNIGTKLWAMYAVSTEPSLIILVAAFLYFSLALAIVFICLIFVILLRRLKFYQHYMRPAEPEMKLDVPAESSHSKPLIDGDVQIVDEKPSQDEGYCTKYREAFKGCWLHCLTLMCVLFCTLTLYPALLARVEPTTEDFFISRFWFADVVAFLVFNIACVLGNVFCEFVQFPSRKWLWLPALIRTIVAIPFFLFCNAMPEIRTIPAYIGDWGFIIGIFLLGFTNGQFISLGLMYAPRTVSPKYASIAAMMAIFCVINGVLIGLPTSLLLCKILDGSFGGDPFYGSQSTNISMPWNTAN